jgi:4-amino-4-deoxy-L-arabinose transferase-like glycosyltransferase
LSFAQKYKNILIVGGVLLAGVGLRLFGLFDPLVGIHDFRETQTASGVWLYSRFGFHFFEYHVVMFGGKFWILEFPLYQVLVHGLSRLFGSFEVMGRLVSIASYVVSGLALYAVSMKTLKDRGRSALAVLVFSVVPFSTYFSRSFIIDPMVLAMCLVILALSLGLGDRFSAGKAAAVGVLFLAAVMVKVTTVVSVLVPAAWLITSGLVRSPADKRKSRFIAAAAALGVVGLAYLAWQSYGFSMNAQSFMLSKADFKNWYFGVRLFEPAFYQTLWMRAYHELGFIGLFVLVLGGYALWREESRSKRPLLLWAASILAYLVVFNNLNFVHIYYQLPLAPFLAVVAAAGMGAVWKTFAGNRKVRIVLAGILLYFVGERALMYWKAYLLYSPEYKQRMLGTAAAIRENTESGDPIILAWPGADPNLPNFLYLSKRIGYNFDLNKLGEIRAVLAHDPAVRTIVAFPVRPENVDPILKSLGDQGVRVGGHKLASSMLFVRVEAPGAP